MMLKTGCSETNCFNGFQSNQRSPKLSLKRHFMPNLCFASTQYWLVWLTEFDWLTLLWTKYFVKVRKKENKKKKSPVSVGIWTQKLSVFRLAGRHSNSSATINVLRLKNLKEWSLYNYLHLFLQRYWSVFCSSSKRCRKSGSRSPASWRPGSFFPRWRPRTSTKSVSWIGLRVTRP